MTENKLTYADKPWLKSYKLGPYPLAKTIDFPKVPIFQFLDDSAAKLPNNVAVLHNDKETTYQELKTYADKLANSLAELGVKKGDPVAVMLPNCLQIIMCMFGITKAGGLYMPITPLAKAPELEHQLTQSGAKVIIAIEEVLDIINKVKSNTKLKHIIITTKKDFSLEEEPEIKEIPGTHNLRKLLAEHEAVPPEIEIDPMVDLATLAFTGGATGVPKGVMRTHYNDVAFSISNLPWVMKPMEVGSRGKASLLTPVPLYHGAGHCQALQSVYWGLRFIFISDPRDTEGIIAAIQKYRPFMVVAVPTQLMRMVQKKIGRTTTLVAVGTSTLPKETAALWKKETGMPVSQGYNLTEGGPVINIHAFSKITGFAAEEKHSIGVPGPNLEMKLVNEETGEEAPFGEAGEIWIRGPQVMAGYWPERGKGLKDGWLPTGDVARMDDEGYLFLEDRIKDMISVSGLKVYSVVVEEALYKHPAVAMAIVIGVPDPDLPGSERVKAFIKLKDNYESPVTGEEIIAYCKTNLPPYAAPKYVEFRDELPLLPGSEKLFKRSLRDEEIAKAKARGELK